MGRVGGAPERQIMCTFELPWHLSLPIIIGIHIHRISDLVKVINNPIV